MDQPRDSIARGIPLSLEPDLGALTLPGYLREVTERFAEREALVMHHGDGRVERWNYAELWARAVEIARALIACGVGKASRVGVMMTNRPEWVAAFFGVGLAGGVATPISTFSTLPELEHLLRHSAVSVLLFEERVLKKDFRSMLIELEPEIGQAAPGRLSSTKLPFLRRLAMVGEGAAEGAIEPWPQWLAHGAETNLDIVDARARSVVPADAGALFFSSGSTGKAKGILSAHRGVAIQSWRFRRILQLGENTRTLSANGFFWSGTFCQALGATLSCGGSLVLLSTFDAAEALRLMEAERVTCVAAWPHQMAQLEAAPNWASTDLSSLSHVDMRWPFGRHPKVATTWQEPRWVYGATETFTLISGFATGTSPEVTGDTHGEPLPGATIKIVDPVTGATVPRGRPGEIVVKGPTLMLGYLGAAPDETLDEQGFFHTRDSGRMDERGRLIWEGRLSDIIKTGGANVSPVEVDAELVRYPGVKRCQTIGAPHDTLGEIVVSCIVPEDGRPLDEGAMREYLRNRLASYKIPRRVLFVDEAELCVTGSDKVKTGALRELVTRKLAAEAHFHGS
jgi:fatty-acyl-CoA synthase